MGEVPAVEVQDLGEAVGGVEPHVAEEASVVLVGVAILHSATATALEAALEAGVRSQAHQAGPSETPPTPSGAAAVGLVVTTQTQSTVPSTSFPVVHTQKS